MQCTEQPCGSLVKKLIGCRLPSGIWIPWNTSKNFGAGTWSCSIENNRIFSIELVAFSYWNPSGKILLKPINLIIKFSNL